MKTIIHIVLIGLVITCVIQAQQYNWTDCSGYKWSSINALSFDSNGTIYAGTADQGKVYRTYDQGRSWEELQVSNNNIRIEQILIVDSLIYIIREKDGIYRSIDNGKSFIKVSQSISNNIINNIVSVSNGKLIALTYPSGVYQSDDLGLNWKEIPSSMENMKAFLNTFNFNDTIFRCSSHNVYRSIDIGDSWKKITIPNEIFKNFFSNESYLYGLTRSCKLYRMLRSKDTFELYNDSLSSLLYKMNYTSIQECLIDNEGKLICCSNNGLLSIDLASMEVKYLIPSTNFIYSQLKFQNGTLYLGGVDGKMYRSSENFSIWKVLNENIIDQDVTDVVAIDDNTLATVINNDKIFKSINSGKSWFKMVDDTLLYRKISRIFIDNKRNFYALIHDSGFYQIDDKGSFIKRESGLSDTISSIICNDMNDIFSITKDSLYKYDNLDSNWLSIGKIYPNSRFINENNSKLLILSSNELWVYDTKNFGIQKLESLPSPSDSISTGDFINESLILIGTKNDGVFRTRNLGRSWERYNNQLYGLNIKEIVKYSDKDYLATTINNGIYDGNVSSDQWYSVGMQLPSSRIRSLYIDEQSRIFCGSKEKGLFRIDYIEFNNIRNDNGWIDSTNFLVEAYKISGISYIKFSKDGSRFFTFSKDNIFRCWSSEDGKLIFEFPLNFSKIANIALNDNERQLAICSNYYYRFKDSYYYSMETIVYDIFQDSVYYKFNVLENKKYDFPVSPEFANRMALFDDRNNLLITCFEAQTSVGTGASRFNSGGYDIWDLNDGKWIKTLKNDVVPHDIQMLHNLKYFALSGCKFSTIREETEYDSRLLFLNSTDSSTFEFGGFRNDEYYKKFSISYDDSLLAITTSHNNLLFYDINIKKNIRKVKVYTRGFNSSDHVYNLSFGNNSNDLYLCSVIVDYNSTPISKKQAIRHYSYNLDRMIDSIVLDNPEEYWNIDISPDSRYLIGGSSYGQIRMWEISKTFDVNEESNIEKYQALNFPNPAENYINITIPSGTFRSIEVFDLLGNTAPIDFELIPSAGEDIIRLDISRLSIGAWYYQVNLSGSPTFGNFQKTK